MANPEHVEFLKKCQVEKIGDWNAWRIEHWLVRPDLRGATLRRAVLQGANLIGADLSVADLIRANLRKVNLTGANLTGANLMSANLINTDLTRTHMVGANLSDADLARANLTSADLTDANLARTYLRGSYLVGANLTSANLTSTNLTSTNLTSAHLNRADLTSATLINTILKNSHLKETSVYGIAAWDVKLEGATQLDLIITPKDEPVVTVDNLKVAQFVYLLLNNAEIREVIDTITSKVILILGRFTPERKAILDALRNELRKHNYSPILFDFEKPGSRDFTETVRTLAHLARFIIADLTEPSSIPLELQAIVPDLMVPVQPLLLEAKREDGQAMREFAMFVDLRRKYSWVLPTGFYQDQAHLLELLPENVIKPAEALAREYYVGRREPE